MPCDPPAEVATPGSGRNVDVTPATGIGPTSAKTCETTLRISFSSNCMARGRDWRLKNRDRRGEIQNAERRRRGVRRGHFFSRICLSSTCIVSTMPMTTASIGKSFVSGVKRALLPWVIKTKSFSPAPIVSTAMNVRPVVTSDLRFSGSKRYGSTTSSLWPVIEATFCVATTDPVTLAMNMGKKLLSVRAGRSAVMVQDFQGSLSDDPFFVGRDGPNLGRRVVGMQRRFARRDVVFSGVQLDAKLRQVRANAGTDRFGVFTDAPGEHDRVDAAQGDHLTAQLPADLFDIHVQGQAGFRVARVGGLFQIADVAAVAADSQQAAFAGQTLQRDFQRFAGSLHDQGQGERVEVADAVVLGKPG